ncbi:hypothetical protein EYF80_021860 [Liparis tanakae]|uniref:Secreted protein n=1 Tax=Liparis tanakae TaxID=230148 RepID=A0A4Z2HQN5_9TELE|nr:hypothetical protein EYF80_021860 [Liparis tanakae]
MCLSSTNLLLLLFITVVIVLESRNRHLVPVGVHGGQKVDAGGVDEALDALVPQLVLGAQVLSQVHQQLAAQGFISVHVADVFHLRLDYRGPHVNCIAVAGSSAGGDSMLSTASPSCSTGKEKKKNANDLLGITVVRHGLSTVSCSQRGANTEQPSMRISGLHCPPSRESTTLMRRYSAPASASLRVLWPRMLGNMV